MDMVLNSLKMKTDYQPVRVHPLEGESRDSRERKYEPVFLRKFSGLLQR